MISIELILPTIQKRLCMTVRESISVGEFKKHLRRFFNIKNDCIFMLTQREIISDDMSLTEAGMFTGSGVIIDNG